LKKNFSGEAEITLFQKDIDWRFEGMKVSKLHAM